MDLLKDSDVENVIKKVMNECLASLNDRTKHIINDKFYGDHNRIKQYIQTDGSLHFNSYEGVLKYTESSGNQPYSKLIGIIQMIELIREIVPSFFNSIGVDFLGGSGQLVKVVNGYLGQECEGFLTADISLKQLIEGLRKGWSMVPCNIVKPESLRKEVLDWGIIAYGFHHIAPENRLDALEASFSKIKRGGVLLLHDGFIGSSTIDIMSKIVDEYSVEKHEFPFLKIEDFERYQSYFVENHGAKVDKYSIFDPMVFFGCDLPSLQEDFSTYMKNHYYLQLNNQEIFNAFEKILHEYSLKEFDMKQAVYIKKEEENLTSLSAGLVFNNGSARKPFAKELYAGTCPDEIKNIYDKVIDTQEYCVIVPRFATVLRITKNT
ncbi:hypothetical protein QNH46_05910 [Paenibacillus woosongensis]|uniref:Uncharacterized protein n=1 Tax=Paenibacillus woosongensis TaxID=307580 RepID=A0AA95KUN3_9BACL|nr:hypothetical protein [Paenibacillus woosongensis]WHX50198.1 hypothetical protein QNH46_05910 [Paenibacillus woosongensis]